MDKETKKEIEKMQMLMERMDKHYTRGQVLFLEESLEEDDKNREINDDKFGSYIGKIQRGWNVHVGYVTSETLSLSRTYPTRDSYDKLSKKLSNNNSEKLNDYLGTSLEDMDNFINNPGKRKSFEFPVKKDNYEIIKFQEYGMKWMDRKALADFYEALTGKELELRKQFGFGQDGAENTWRGKSDVYKSGKHAGETKWTYGGSGLNPIISTSVGGNHYNNASGEEGFHDSWKDPETGKYSLRQIPTKYGDARYFLHNLNDDTYEEVGKDIIYSLLYDFKAPKVEKELEEDERQFVEEMSKINAEKSSAWNLLEEKCLFISYTVKMEDGTKRAHRLVNPELKQKLEPIIDKLGIRDRITES